MAVMTNRVIEIDDVSKRLSGATILRSVSLQVAEGESVAMIGLNGAGKTTLLRCLLDFQRPDSGSVRIDGCSSARAVARTRLAFLPERFLPPAFLTGIEFLQLSASLHGQPWKPELARMRCGELDLDWASLGNAVSSLSKGMTQKLGLAACLLSLKRLYIMDEPLSGLDVQARALAIAQLQKLRDEGCTLLFTSHEPEDLEHLCDRLAVLDRGQLQFCDTPAALCERFSSESLKSAVLACLAHAA